MRTYTVQEGKQAARPMVINFGTGRNPVNGWEIFLRDGWDYRLEKNQTQWVKLCGDTFNAFNRDKNTILLGARSLPGAGIQITPYYNVDGRIYTVDHPETPEELRKDWPKLTVLAGNRITFAYKCEGARVTATILYKDARIVHRFTHSGIGCIQSEVNFYFGGTQPAPNDISIDKHRLTALNWGPDGGLNSGL